MFNNDSNIFDSRDLSGYVAKKNKIKKTKQTKNWEKKKKKLLQNFCSRFRYPNQINSNSCLFIFFASFFRTFASLARLGPSPIVWYNFNPIIHGLIYYISSILFWFHVHQFLSLMGDIIIQRFPYPIFHRGSRNNKKSNKE